MARAELEQTIRKLQSGELPVDFNWNADKFPGLPLARVIRSEPTASQVVRTALMSEDLRDGLHGVEAQPGVEKKIDYIGRLREFGINIATVGIFSGIGNVMDKNTRTLLRMMNERFPDVTPAVLTLATDEALEWTIACKRINPKLESVAFMGSAPFRMLVEGWSKDYVLHRLDWLTSSLCAEGISVIGATEHTTQTPPDFLRQIVETVVNAGAKGFCVSDTIGIARPVGTARVVRFVGDTLVDMGRPDVDIHWHGHRDTGNDVGNANAAVAAGANILHVVAGGVGERAGNTPLEVMAINFTRILNETGKKSPWKLELLNRLLSSYYDLTELPTPKHGPLSERAFKTSLGIHVSAMLKAMELAQEADRLGDKSLSVRLTDMGDTVYSALNSESVGRQPEICVGPWSGSSNVKMAARLLGMTVDEGQISFILDVAKKGGRELTADELRRYLSNHH